MDIISPVLQTIQLALDRSFVFTLVEQEQLQQCSSSLGIWHCENQKHSKKRYNNGESQAATLQILKQP